MSQVHDQLVYDHVNTELRSGLREQGVWDKALEVYGENDRRAEAAYVEMRVAQIERERRKVRVVAQHQRRFYGFNHLMFWVGWMPPIGTWYLADKGVAMGRALVPLVVSLTGIFSVAFAFLYLSAFKLVAIALILGAWAAAWVALSWLTNRWVAETIEPLKSMLRTVSKRDIKAWDRGERMLVEQL